MAFAIENKVLTVTRTGSDDEYEITVRQEYRLRDGLITHIVFDNLNDAAVSALGESSIKDRDTAVLAAADGA